MSTTGTTAGDAQLRGESTFSQPKQEAPILQKVHDGQQAGVVGDTATATTTTGAGQPGIMTSEAGSGIAPSAVPGQTTGPGTASHSTKGSISSTGTGTGSGAGTNIGTSTGVPSAPISSSSSAANKTTSTSSPSTPGAQGTAASSGGSTTVPQGARAHPDNLPQTAKDASVIGTIAGDNVSFKEQVQGHAKYFAGKIFGNDKEVQEGSARVAGVETADPSTLANKAGTQTSSK